MNWCQALCFSWFLLSLELKFQLSLENYGGVEEEQENHQSQCCLHLFTFLFIVVYILSDILFIQYLVVPFVLELIYFFPTKNLINTYYRCFIQFKASSKPLNCRRKDLKSKFNKHRNCLVSKIVCRKPPKCPRTGNVWVPDSIYM